MKNSTSTIHYHPGEQPKVSAKTAIIVLASAIALVVAVIAIVR
ncbi:MAG TPA: hypothetical protein VN775_07985 [Opitutaceae bacterium]|nr:hypothetical protein [Opitutaceae bacterium]